MRGDEKSAKRATGCSRCGKLQSQVERLEREIAELRKRLENAERAGKRQAAPFSKGEPKDEPKKPGRKPGKGYGKRASRSRPERVSTLVVFADVLASPDHSLV